MRSFKITIEGDCPDETVDAHVMRLATDMVATLLDAPTWMDQTLYVTNSRLDVQFGENPESKLWTVALINPKDKKIQTIKEVRSYLNLGLKEAKDLVDRAPSLLTTEMTKAQADEFVQALEAAGAQVTTYQGVTK